MKLFASPSVSILLLLQQGSELDLPQSESLTVSSIRWAFLALLTLTPNRDRDMPPPRAHIAVLACASPIDSPLRLCPSVVTHLSIGAGQLSFSLQSTH